MVRSRAGSAAACAQPVVVREALRALVDGQPRLLRLSKDTPAEGRRGDGVVELVMTCHSGGTLEIYVEPHLPAPILWVVGTTPIAGALVALGSAAGWRVSVFDPVADPDAFRAAEQVVVGTDLEGHEPEVAPAIVVATQGVWDEEALAAALARNAAYVGLVASPTRAAVVRDVAPRGGRDRRRTAGRAAGTGRAGPRWRDRGGSRPVHPRRAGAGPARDGDVRGLSRSGHARRRSRRPRSCRPSTTSCSSTPCAA